MSTALIPFLEHDDASRALMGSNMQRQGVPLIKTQSPIVGTGMEQEIGKSSNAVLRALHNGVVTYVSADTVIIQADEDQFLNLDDWIAEGIETYHLRKFRRSSMSTWIHQQPIVQRG